jgi:hypothetical protein
MPTPGAEHPRVRPQNDSALDRQMRSAFGRRKKGAKDRSKRVDHVASDDRRSGFRFLDSASQPTRFVEAVDFEVDLLDSVVGAYLDHEIYTGADAAPLLSRLG